MNTLTTIPEFWEFIIKKYVKKTFFMGTRKEVFADKPEFMEGDYRFFAKGIRDLSTAFTEERHHLPVNYLNQKEYRSGYILYFMPINAFKVTLLLQKTQTLPAPQKDMTLHFLDLGCGPGTAMIGTFQALEEAYLKTSDVETLSIHWTLVDQNKLILQDAQAFHDSFLFEFRKKYPAKKISSTVHLVSANLFTQKLHQAVTPQKYDIIFALNFLNEFPREKRLQLIDALSRNYLQENGKIFLMEPALRLTTRDIMQLRDDILSNEIISVLSPCLHQKDCPMLADNHRDWCHSYLEWTRPRWIEKLDYLAGIKKDYLKCSYLILGRNPAVYKPNEWRVVSGALNSNGKSERLLCGPGGLPELLRITRLDKEASQHNKAFETLGRGDLAQVPKQGRINKDTYLQKIPNK